MCVVRSRLDFIASARHIDVDPFSIAEVCAFHGRKVIEGIAFGCLIAVEHGLKHVPRDAKGQWSAESILRSLKGKNLN